MTTIISYGNIEFECDMDGGEIFAIHAATDSKGQELDPQQAMTMLGIDEAVLAAEYWTNKADQFHDWMVDKHREDIDSLEEDSE